MLATRTSISSIEWCMAIGGARVDRAQPPRPRRSRHSTPSSPLRRRESPSAAPARTRSCSEFATRRQARPSGRRGPTSNVRPDGSAKCRAGPRCAAACAATESSCRRRCRPRRSLPARRSAGPCRSGGCRKAALRAVRLARCDERSATARSACPAATGCRRSWRRRSRLACGSRRRAFAGSPRHEP